MKLSHLFFSVLALLPLVSCSGGGGGDDENFSVDACSEVGAKIINGDQCSIGDSPIVRLGVVDFFGFESGSCTGTVISSRAVLTAAHCFPFGTLGLIVHTGSKDVLSSTFESHPQYGAASNGGSLLHDVGIVFTDEDLGVRTYPLLTSREAFVGEEGIVTGYGVDENNEGEIFRAGNAFVSDVSSNHVSTAYDGEGSNPCLGDSGGPLLLSQGGGYAIAGVVSTGRASVENCGPGDVTLYTALASSTNANFVRQRVPDIAEQ